VLARFLEMVLEGLPQLVVRGRLGHLRQGRNELGLGAIEIRDFVFEQVLHCLQLH
jgi:hypothetical protein